ncbi:MAG: peroxide stress protein YaaA [Pirellula sp.]|nr:peroxide stress protein YaaA [Pirellula sp.]
MLILISPAKTLDLTPQAPYAGTKPQFLTQANRLAKLAKTLPPAKLAKLMSISPQLAEKTHGYFASWKAKYDAAGAKEAVFAFRGDVYLGLEAWTLGEADLAFAQDHLRILSGLYGVLRPLDLIQPYRLEMSIKLAGDYGKDLYAHWGDTIAKTLTKEAKRHDDSTIVNLASQEYFAVADRTALKPRVITPSFHEKHNGKFTVISFFAKKARGMMARHLIETHAESPAAIKTFRAGGYRFNADLSTDDEPAFTRDKPPAVGVA